MINSDTEILFPIRVIASLRDLRGEKWAQLIDHLDSPDVDELELVGLA